MSIGSFVDHYECLQVSPNADPDTIHRVYRILAQRLHPDNRESGDAERFHNLSVAYRILSDPEQRAAYDVQHQEARRLTWKIFDRSSSEYSVTGERRKREGVLNLLYRKRAAQPETPHLTLKELEDLLGVPKEHLEFTLWYLKEGQFIQRMDSGRSIITMKGVDLAEQMMEGHAVSPAAGYIESHREMVA